MLRIHITKINLKKYIPVAVEMFSPKRCKLNELGESSVGTKRDIPIKTLYISPIQQNVSMLIDFK